MANTVNTLYTGSWSRHRLLEGTVSADAAVDASFPVRRGLLNCRGWETVRVAIRETNGGTVTLEHLLYDEDLDDFVVLGTTATVADGGFFEVTVYEGRVFFRVSAVATVPQNVDIRVMPGRKAPIGAS